MHDFSLIAGLYSQVLIYTAESTGASVKRTKMPNLRNGSKGGFEPGFTRLRVRHSTAELPRSTKRDNETEKYIRLVKVMYHQYETVIIIIIIIVFIYIAPYIRN